ncbi:hypothetical protein VFPPC_04038 [Pochonia chlamydosporia 170]|uniref:Uncharacterized protein n=1 Tax=Pochonia chlamydosporia 170 TaxID=1380566 RepID=A0A179FRG8_METCM|nr:hypothetical protein VFPPC_04038 [Pochonia chlamydosporia 170]OAQ67683.2 hypothetical protein VFPPC_04038 [Pochonia chlamydosporia 170]
MAGGYCVSNPSNEFLPLAQEGATSLCEPAPSVVSKLTKPHAGLKLASCWSHTSNGIPISSILCHVPSRIDSHLASHHLSSLVSTTDARVNLLASSPPEHFDHARDTCS